jgi:hypothetical protein
MWHVWETAEVLKGFWWGDPRKKDNLENLGVDGWITLERIFKRWNGGHGLD